MKKIFSIIAASALCTAVFAQQTDSLKTLSATVDSLRAEVDSLKTINAQQAAAIAAAAIAAAPQEEVAPAKPVYWKNTLQANLDFIQAGYNNWAKGGVSNYSLAAYVDANANYAKDNFYWNNRLQMDYGALYSKDKPIFQKTKDRILFESTAGLKATETINYTAKFTFLNQFSRGYTYNTPSVEGDVTREDWMDARVLKSAGFAPAIVTLGLGIDWIPNDWLTVNFAPLTGGFTIVTNEALRQIYGMGLKDGYTEDDATTDDNGLLTNGEIYKSARFELGAQLTATAKVQINDNIAAQTQLILFSNYLKNPQNLRVNWDNRLSWKLAKYFALSFTTSLIYDDTVLIIDDDHPEGHKAIQFYEALQFGFTYSLPLAK